MMRRAYIEILNNIIIKENIKGSIATRKCICIFRGTRLSNIRTDKNNTGSARIK